MRSTYKAFRKMIAFMLCLALTFVYPITALASDTINISTNDVSLWGFTYDSNDLTYKEIHDAAGNEFVLIEVNPTGYFIYDPASGQYLEGSAEAPSPYLDLEDNLIYLGPQNYYQIHESVLYHTIYEEEYSISSSELNNMQDSFSIALSNVRENTSINISDELPDAELNGNYDNMIKLQYDGYNSYYVKNYWNITDATYPANMSDTCGYVAACILLYYWHKRITGGVVIPYYYLLDGKLKTNGTTVNDNLQLKLITYNNGGKSWGGEIADVLQDYCDEFGFNAVASYEVLNIGTDTQLKNNRPVILFGLFPDLPSDKKTDHAVVAYGFHVPDDSLTTAYYVHYGWTGYSRVILNSGLVASTTEFKPSSSYGV